MRLGNNFFFGQNIKFMQKASYWCKETICMAFLTPFMAHLKIKGEIKFFTIFTKQHKNFLPSMYKSRMFDIDKE